MSDTKWDDLRFLIAVAETGTVSAAARRLKVTHGTVLRRVAAYEERMGEPVFARSPTGYRVLPGKETVIDAAREVENAVLTVDRMLTGHGQEIRGTVRITSTDSLCQTILPGAVAELCARYPDLSVSLLSTNAHLDFTRTAVDISVRPAPALPDGLVGEEVARLVFSVYGAPGGADRWLGLDGPLARSAPARWMSEMLEPAQIGPGSDSFLALREMVATGLGRAWMPRLVAEADPRLARTHEAPDLSIPVWIACQPELANSTRMRAVRAALAEAVAARSAMLSETGFVALHGA